VVPSLTLDPDSLAKIAGITFYEERLLFLLIRLRNPRARMVYVTSLPIHPLVVDYYLQMLAGVPAGHARARLTLLCAQDATPRPLTEKILERPRLLERIRAAIPDRARAYLSVFNSTPLERRLAVLLGIPMNGVDPRLLGLGTKSGSRRIFREAGVTHPAGFEDVSGRKDLQRALRALRDLRPGLRRAVIKREDSFSGEGNAVFLYPREDGPRGFERALARVRPAAPDLAPRAFLDRLEGEKAVVEEMIEGGECASPSAQLRVNPRGQVILIATHDQILGGPGGQTFVGCRFPASDDWRLTVQAAGRRIGERLAAHGVVSRFSVDFLVRRRAGESPEVHALEINLRMGGTTHPFLALRFLSGGSLQETTGLFFSPRGRAQYYRSTDNLCDERYRGLLPEDLVDILTVNRLHYDHESESGVLFHMMGALSQHGKMGLTAIGGSREEAEALYARTVAILDAETVYGRPGPGSNDPLPRSRERRQ
jgi:hypothetical protein